MVTIKCAGVIIALQILLICSANATTRLFSRDFQLILDTNKFDSREVTVNNYFNSWARAAGTTLEQLHGIRANSIREETHYALTNCDTTDFRVIQYNYTSGDWTGLAVTQIKTTTPDMTEREAIETDFTASQSYKPSAVELLAHEISPCTAQWTDTMQIIQDTLPEIHTCGDIDDIFVDTMPSTTGRTKTDLFYAFVAYQNGTYKDSDMWLQIVIGYNSLEDANNDQHRQWGLFSFVTHGISDRYSVDMTESCIRIYKSLLKSIGDPRYPCVPKVDINSFFHPGETDFLPGSIDFFPSSNNLNPGVVDDNEDGNVHCLPDSAQNGNGIGNNNPTGYCYVYNNEDPASSLLVPAVIVLALASLLL